MSYALRATPSRCITTATGRPSRVVVIRATSQQQQNHTLKGAAVSAVAAAVLFAYAPAFAIDASAPALSGTGEIAAEASQPREASSVTSISFSRVDMSVTKKLRERDENMAWKCQGVNMYDCDGELAEAAEKRFEEMAKMFRTPSD